MNATAATDIGAAEIVGHYINGAAVEDTARTLPVTNPATGAVTKQVAMASRATVEDAIAAAEAAFPAWRNTPPAKRAKIMFKFKQLLEEHADDIVALLTSEHGKVLDDAMGEFLRGVEVVDYACGISELLKGEHSRNVGPNIDSWSRISAARRRCGHHTFQFSGNGTDVDVPDGHCMWQHLCAEALRERSQRADVYRKTVCRGGLAGWRLQRCQWR